MATKKQTSKGVSFLLNNNPMRVRKIYLNDFPDFKVKVGSSEYVPVIDHQYGRRSEGHWRNEIDDWARYYGLYDKQNRPIQRKGNHIEIKRLRHREVSVPRNSYIRAINKAIQRFDDRCAADPSLNMTKERDYEFEEYNRALSDLARRTRSRRRMSGKTSLRR